jgi:hypothetical protein
MLVYSARIARSRDREPLAAWVAELVDVVAVGAVADGPEEEPVPAEVEAMFEDWITETRGSAHVTPRWKLADWATVGVGVVVGVGISSARESERVRLFWRLDFSPES